MFIQRLSSIQFNPINDNNFGGTLWQLGIIAGKKKLVSFSTQPTHDE